MVLGKVVGSIVSTIKHPSYEGKKLMIVRMTSPAGELLKQSMLAVDAAQAGVGDWVLVASEGKSTAEIFGYDAPVPIRDVIVGIVDRVQQGRRGT